MDKPKKLTLITNIRFIQQESLRIECSALLIEENTEGLFKEKQSRIRGFGPDGAWPTFTLWLKPGTTWSIEGKTDSGDSAVIMGKDSTPRPLFSGSVLVLSSGERFFLQADSDGRPLDLMDVTATEYEDIWEALQRKATTYWHTPNMPMLRWAPVERLRRVLESL